jgi:hypothetical protein
MRLLLALSLAAFGCTDSSSPCPEGATCATPLGMPSGDQPGNPDPGTTGMTTTVTDMGMMMSMSGGCCDMGMSDPAGPWPVADLTVYDQFGAIFDSGPDDAQNIWAVSHDTLYLLRPGSSTPLKFTAADGLHIGPFIDWYKNPNTTSITAMAGGHANEVFVGYYGYESEGDPFQDTEAQKELGNADKVVFDPSTGKITVTRYLFRCDYDSGAGCWEDRSPRRMVVSHTGAAADHLFIGFNHGVSHVFNDQFGDHVHPEIWWHNPDGTTVEKLGEFYGVAVDPKGNAWVAGKYGVGLQPFNATPHFNWVDGTWIYAFTIYGTGHGLDVPAGYSEDNSAVAVMPNGHVYIGSFGKGMTHWDPATGNYGSMTQVTGVPGSILDLAADPDGTLWMVDGGGALWRYNPATGQAMAWAGISGAHRVVVDTTVTPRAVYVSTDGGPAVIRAK